MDKDQDFTISVAPMMDWTDRYCRWFHRRLSRRALLYTEMVVADAVIHGDREYLIGFDPAEHPLALQIGGSDPAKLAQASKIGQGYGYDEININIGCPSDRVQSGRFGACLMEEPDLVADCYKAMQDAVDIPVTVKCRLGVDDQDVASTLPHFIETVSKAGCATFIIHARKAWLKGLSPKENRHIPPLDYDLVHAMKARWPELDIQINGGITTLDEAREHGEGLDGVMLGRAAYQTPWVLSGVDSAFYGEADPAQSRHSVAEDLIRFTESEAAAGRNPKALCRHALGLYHGLPGARSWRRALTEGGPNGLTPAQTIAEALSIMQSRSSAA